MLKRKFEQMTKHIFLVSLWLSQEPLTYPYIYLYKKREFVENVTVYIYKGRVSDIEHSCMNIENVYFIYMHT